MACAALNRRANQIMRTSSFSLATPRRACRSMLIAILARFTWGAPSAICQLRG